MSLQDNIFDVQAALKGKPELEFFEEILEHYYSIERKHEVLSSWLFKIEQGNFYLNKVKTGDYREFM